MFDCAPRLTGYFVNLLYSMGLEFPLSLAGASGEIVSVSATKQGVGSFNLLAFLVTLVIMGAAAFFLSRVARLV